MDTDPLAFLTHVYNNHADEVGSRHGVPGVGSLRSYLTPPGWRQGQDPIRPEHARELFAQSREQAARLLDEQAVDDHCFQGPALTERINERDAAHKKSRALDQAICRERIEVYRQQARDGQLHGHAANPCDAPQTSESNADDNTGQSQTDQQLRSHLPSLLKGNFILPGPQARFLSQQMLEAQGTGNHESRSERQVHDASQNVSISNDHIRQGHIHAGNYPASQQNRANHQSSLGPVRQGQALGIPVQDNSPTSPSGQLASSGLSNGSHQPNCSNSPSIQTPNAMSHRHPGSMQENITEYNYAVQSPQTNTSAGSPSVHQDGSSLPRHANTARDTTVATNIHGEVNGIALNGKRVRDYSETSQNNGRNGHHGALLNQSLQNNSWGSESFGHSNGSYASRAQEAQSAFQARNGFSNTHSRSTYYDSVAQTNRERQDIAPQGGQIAVSSARHRINGPSAECHTSSSVTEAGDSAQHSRQGNGHIHASAPPARRETQMLPPAIPRATATARGQNVTSPKNVCYTTTTSRAGEPRGNSPSESPYPFLSRATQLSPRQGPAHQQLTDGAIASSQPSSTHDITNSRSSTGDREAAETTSGRAQSRKKLGEGKSSSPALRSSPRKKANKRYVEDDETEDEIPTPVRRPVADADKQITCEAPSPTGVNRRGSANGSRKRAKVGEGSSKEVKTAGRSPRRGKNSAWLEEAKKEGQAAMGPPPMSNALSKGNPELIQ
ncbi:MAG: hypothetical protein LQ340_001161 [Diploschistes diacapsis]|nr:MAG: hypothetical protein LQ340_001161 [Diploschistes diacapsis]